MSEPFTRENVVAYARATLIGTPFHDQAAIPGVGCDCLGIARCIGRHFGRPEADAFDNDVRFKGYSRYPNKRQLLEGCESYFDPVNIADGLPGDMVLASVEIEPQHFALLSSLDPPRVIHAYLQVGRVVENIINDDWRAHVLRMFSFRGIE
jgi:hypothetical protein